MKNWFKKSFKFSNSEEKGRIALLFCFWVFFFAVLTKAYWYPNSNTTDGTSLELVYIDTIKPIAIAEPHASGLKVEALVPFDPNTVDTTFLNRINLPNNLVSNWMKYLNAGGKFYKKEDVKRLYGLQDSTYNTLLPYVRIEKQPASKKEVPPVVKITTKAKELIPFNINLADSAMFTTVKGIGPTYAGRIVRYRNALGGFRHKRQLLEVYGIDSATILQNNHLWKIEKPALELININTVEFKPLLRHPYFNYKQVKAIMNYRQQHGEFLRKNDLLKIVVLDSIWFQKIEPYIIVE